MRNRVHVRPEWMEESVRRTKIQEVGATGGRIEDVTIIRNDYLTPCLKIGGYSKWKQMVCCGHPGRSWLKEEAV